MVVDEQKIAVKEELPQNITDGDTLQEIATAFETVHK